MVSWLLTRLHTNQPSQPNPLFTTHRLGVMKLLNSTIIITMFSSSFSYRFSLFHRSRVLFSTNKQVKYLGRLPIKASRDSPPDGQTCAITVSHLSRIRSRVRHRRDLSFRWTKLETSPFPTPFIYVYIYILLDGHRHANYTL